MVKDRCDNMEIKVNKSIKETTTLTTECQTFIENVKMRIKDCETVMGSRVTKDVVSHMGREIESRLRQYITDTHQKVVSRISTTCN